MHNARAQYIDLCSPVATLIITDPMHIDMKPTIDGPLAQVLLSDVPAGLKQELALARPLLSESLRDVHELAALDIVEHDDIRARIDRLVRLRLGADLDLEQKAEPADLAGLRDRLRYRTFPIAVSLPNSHRRG